jgi:endoribonuclease Dicer
MIASFEMEVADEVEAEIQTDVLLQLRDYQKEIATKAKFENTIAFLPTGAGKTLIACDVISSRLSEVRKYGLLIAFIAPKKALLDQQLEYIRNNSEFEAKVKKFAGGTINDDDKDIDFWQESDWMAELENCEVRK